jgi:hypothetical protein
MKMLTNIRDLEPFGIQMLTGEACAFSMRLLCDINQKGLDLIQEYLGTGEIEVNSQWKNGDIGGCGERIGSMMLPHSVLWDLLVFAHLKQGFTVVRCRHDILVLDDDDKAHWKREDLSSVYDVVRYYDAIGGPRVGTRMVHQMSGRSE